MRCAMYKIIVVALFGLLAVGAARAQSAHDIIAAADRIRNPDQPFRSSTTLTEYVRGQAKDQTVLVVYSKEDKTTGQFRNLVRYVEPPGTPARWPCWMARTSGSMTRRRSPASASPPSSAWLARLPSATFSPSTSRSTTAAPSLAKKRSPTPNASHATAGTST